MRYIRAFFVCGQIFFLIYLIALFLSLFVPLVGKSLHNREYESKKAEVEKQIKESLLK